MTQMELDSHERNVEERTDFVGCGVMGVETELVGVGEYSWSHKLELENGWVILSKK